MAEGNPRFTHANLCLIGVSSVAPLLSASSALSAASAVNRLLGLPKLLGMPPWKTRVGRLGGGSAVMRAWSGVFFWRPFDS